MDIEIKNILEKIEENGFEAYIVGGYVRDYLLGIKSLDVDISTNALPKDVINIFNIKKETSSYGSITIKNGKYNFDITTYRKESNYENRRPQTVEYTNNLILDIKRRDFTINSICMNKEGTIFDYLNGQKDLENHLIKVIGNTDEKLTEDPLRILRAIRFSIILGFKLDDEIINFINLHKDLIKNLSYTRKKEELDKIFSSKNVLKGLKFLKELDLLSALEINYDKIIHSSDLLAIWSQISFSPNYPFTKDNLKVINKIREITKQGKIDCLTLYKEGLYICQVAASVLKINKQEINNMYANMQIKSRKDICINNIDIINILNIKPSKKLKDVYNDIELNIITNSLKNDYEEIKKYLLQKWK